MLPGIPVLWYSVTRPLNSPGTPSAFSLAEPLFNQSMTLEVVPGWLGERPGYIPVGHSVHLLMVQLLLMESMNP